MNGKDKCKMLKEIRRQIAEQNDIEWVTSECQHKGNCKGTCPKCESEVRRLERALERRRALGKAVMVVGVSTLVLTGMAGCRMIRGGGELEGDVPYEGGIETAPLEGEIATDEYHELDGDIAIDETPGLGGRREPVDVPDKEIVTEPIGEIEPPTDEVDK